MRLFIILAVCFAAVNCSNLPPEVADIFGEKCPRQDPKLVKCLLKTVEKLKPSLKKGIHSINIPRLEPFKMRELNLDAEIPGLVLKGTATNIVAYGASDFVIQSLKVDLENFHFDVQIFIPQMSVTADYDTMGSKFFTTDINGSGQFKAQLTGITANVVADGHSIQKNGEEFAKIDDLSVQVTIGGGKIHVDPDEKSLAATTAVNLIKASGNKILSEISPVINKAAAPIVKRYATKILNVLSLDDMLL